MDFDGAVCFKELADLLALAGLVGVVINGDQ
jgi:hypothetical protein